MAELALQMRSPTGVLVAQPHIPFTALKWALQENTFGVLNASGPLAELDPSYFALDARFEVLRSVDGNPYYIEGNTQFLLRYWAFDEDSETWTIEAYTPEYRLTGLVVDTYASTDLVTNALATKTDAADDVIKAYLRQNGGASTTTAARVWGELTVDADTNAAQSITKSASRKELLSVFQDISGDSNALGTYLSFGLTNTSSSGTGWTFHTWTEQRGMDHRRGTKNEVIVSRTMGNLRGGRVEYDHRAEYTSVTAAGQGDGIARATVRLEDTERSAASPNAYREKVIDAAMSETTAALTAEAQAELERCRPRIGFTGKFVDTEYARYGERVGFGDLVTAEAMGLSFACRVFRVEGSWSEGAGEALNIDLIGEA